RAYRKLREIAEQCEARGDPEAAIFAWRAMRSAAIGSRSWLTTHDEERASADAAIARISAATRAAAARPSAAPQSARAYRAMMSADTAPSMGWGLLLLAGAALWVTAGVRLSRRGFDLEDRLQAREARTAAVLAVAALGAWLAGLL